MWPAADGEDFARCSECGGRLDRRGDCGPCGLSMNLYDPVPVLRLVQPPEPENTAA